MSTNFWLKLKKKKPILALAPMAGITDCAFRVLCREMGADVVYSEMVSADALYYNSKKTIELLKIDKKESPVVVQLFGKRPELFGKATKIVEEAGADGVDINFGCPAKKVVNHGGGVTLMRNLPLCKEIIEAVIEVANIPVSVKIRSGIQGSKFQISNFKFQKNDKISNFKFQKGMNERQNITALDFMKNIIDLPISAVMVHGRTYEQGFSGEPDYEMIKDVVDLMKTSPLSPPQRRGNIVVLANGGIKTVEDAKIMLEETGVDGLGIAQGVFGKPWIFRDIQEYLRVKTSPQPTVAEIKKIALRHAKLAYKMKGDYGIIEMRKHLLWYVKGWENAKELREKLVRVESVEDIKKVLSI